MPINRRNLLLGASTLASAAVLSGRAPAAPRKLIMQTGSPSPNSGFIPLYTAQKLGFFAEEGIEVEVRYTRGATVAMQLVSAGQADVGFFVYDALISGYGEGLRGTYFYQYYNKPIFLVAVPEEGNIRTAADLAGKRIGVASLGSVGVPIAKSMMRSVGADPASATFVPIGVGNQAMVALTGNQVDAVSLWDAPLGMLEVLGAKLRYIEHPKIKNVGSGGYVAGQNVFRDRQDDLIGFGRAVAKGSAFTLANPEAAIGIYWDVNPSSRPSGPEADGLKTMLTETKFIFENMKPTSMDGRETDIRQHRAGFSAAIHRCQRGGAQSENTAEGRGYRRSKACPHDQ